MNSANATSIQISIHFLSWINEQLRERISTRVQRSVPKRYGLPHYLTFGLWTVSLVYLTIMQF